MRIALLILICFCSGCAITSEFRVSFKDKQGTDYSVGLTLKDKKV